MPDGQSNFLGENSSEHVAFQLMHMIMAQENKPNVSRDDILSTYAQCIAVVRSGEFNPVAATESRDASKLLPAGEASRSRKRDQSGR